MCFILFFMAFVDLQWGVVLVSPASVMGDVEERDRQSYTNSPVITDGTPELALLWSDAGPE